MAATTTTCRRWGAASESGRLADLGEDDMSEVEMSELDKCAAAAQAALGLDLPPAGPVLPYDREEAVLALRRWGYRFAEALAADQPLAASCLTEALLVGRHGGLPGLSDAGVLLLFARLLRAADHGGSLAEAAADLVERGALRPAEVGFVRAAYRAYGQARLAAALASEVERPPPDPRLRCLPRAGRRRRAGGVPGDRPRRRPPAAAGLRRPGC